MFILSSCDFRRSTGDLNESYFPLEKGLAWQYRLETTLTGGPTNSSSLSVENLGRQTYREQDYHVRRTSNGTDYYLRRDANGIFRHAKRTIVETDPAFDATPRMVLPKPIPKKTGKSWSVLTQSYTLHRVIPHFEPPHANVAHFHMTYSLVGLDEEVSVPAGRFRHCLLIEGQAQVDQFAGANEGTGEIEITTREWYAPGVGMVKMERLEPLDGSVFKGGKISMELVSYSAS